VIQSVPDTTVPTDPSADLSAPAGYTFGGWKDIASTVYQPGTALPAVNGGPAEYWAKWIQVPDLKITFVSDKNATGLTINVPDDGTVTLSDALLPAGSDQTLCGSGYQAGGWTPTAWTGSATDSSGNPVDPNGGPIGMGMIATTDMTFSTVCEEAVPTIPVVVHFNGNTPCDKCGSTVTGPDPDSQTWVVDKHGNPVKVSGQKVPVTLGVAFKPYTSVSVTGYTLTGWASITGHGRSQVVKFYPLDANGKIMINSMNGVKVPNRGSASVTLYAVWAPVPIKVIFDANAPAGVQAKNMPSSIRAKFCDSLRVKGDPKAKGYTFMGWNTAADGSGTAYAPGDRILVNVFSTDKHGNNSLTLYAQWAAGDVPAPTPSEPATPDNTPSPVSPSTPGGGGTAVAPTGGSVAGSATTAGVVGMLMLVAAGGVFMVSRRRLAIH